MNGFAVNQPQEDSGYSTLRNNVTVDQQEIQRLYESVLHGGDLLLSCPTLGIQTVAETTSKTGSLRQDGLSSLPLRLCIDSEPVETTVLDSSSPLDGVPLSYLLYGVVELTSNTVPLDYAHYCGSSAVIVEVDEMSCHVCVEVCADSTRIKVTNSRMLTLSTPIPGDTVRVIRGDTIAGSIGSVSARRDDSQVMVKLENSTSSTIMHVSDLVRIDTTAAATSSPPTMGSVEDTDMSSDQSNRFSPAYSTGWRVNSPIPPSPIDSVVSNYENSPSSSLVGGSSTGGVTSPGNVWNNTSVPSEPLANLTFSLTPDSAGATTSPPSNASSTNSINHLHQQPATPGQTIQHCDSYPGNFIRTENYQNTTAGMATGMMGNAGASNSLPLANKFPQHEVNHSQPFTDSVNKPTSPSNLYPTLNVDSNMYSPQPSPTLNPQSGSHSQVGVSYPSLPSYSSATQYAAASQPYPQQPQYTPVLLTNANNTGYIYGYQSTAYQSVTPIYQPKGVAFCGTRMPQTYQYGANHSMGQTPSSLYPQLHCLNSQSPYTARQQPNSSPSTAAYLAATKKLQQPSSFPSGLYPTLPSSSLKQKPQQPSPWEEFRLLVNSVQCNSVSSQKPSLEGFIDMAIKALCDREPPQQWYNPLAKSDDDDMCGSDLSTESVQVSVLCPLIRMRMQFPCRGLECTHLQCFDAKAYLRLALKRRSQLVSTLKGAAVPQSCHPDNGWKCPTCGKVVSVSQLYIEKHLQKAISVYSESSELEFKGPGHWVPYEKFQPPSNSVIDLTMDSDDDP